MTKKDYVALAAPDMYEALKTIVLCLNRRGDNKNNYIIDLAIKALFKAKESEAPQDVNVYYGLNGAPADIPLGTFKTFPKGEEK